jgi:hypothetical protein
MLYLLARRRATNTGSVRECSLSACIRVYNLLIYRSTRCALVQYAAAEQQHQIRFTGYKCLGEYSFIVCGVDALARTLKRRTKTHKDTDNFLSGDAEPG